MQTYRLANHVPCVAITTRAVLTRHEAWRRLVSRVDLARARIAVGSLALALCACSTSSESRSGSMDAVGAESRSSAAGEDGSPGPVSGADRDTASDGQNGAPRASEGGTLDPARVDTEGPGGGADTTDDRDGADDEADGPPPARYAPIGMDPDWKFIRQDVAEAREPGFDDSSWSTVSTPHTYNDVDSYTTHISNSGGDRPSFTGPTWYRKHFKIPGRYADGKVIVEFERIRQAAHFYVNGTDLGLHEDGVTAAGIDLTGYVNFGDVENVLAVRVDNGNNYVESTTGVGFQWAGKAFNPNYGGLIGHVWLHLSGKIYQTYPLFNNLATSGTYIYASAFSNVRADRGDLTVNVESQVKNESAAAADVTLSVRVVDPVSGDQVTAFQGQATRVDAGATLSLNASGALAEAKLWSDETPNLYDVTTELLVDDVVANGRTTRTGFRQAEFRGGIGTGGLYLNGRFVYLLGFAQRASNDWAALGGAVPDWMHDYDAALVKASNSNYIRWMHVTPQPVDVIADDKAGIVNIAPAGDKETDVTGVQWTQRTKVMRASIIYLRNHPSILFWEAGNNGITAAHMQEMAELKERWDPSGGRAVGCRSLSDRAAAPFAEYFGTIVAYNGREFNNQTDYFRGYSNAYRDQAPIIEAEDERDEAARRFWDAYSPPHFGFTPGPNDTWHWDSETIITGDGAGAAIRRLDIWKNQFSIRNTDSTHSRYAGYASIYWSDSNADGRQESSEVARVSGKVDAVRLPKQLFYAHRVVGSTEPDLHVIGHWTYPAGTVKPVNVVANTSSVELFVNDVSLGRSSTPTDTYLFTFRDVAWQSGSIRAVGYDASNVPVVEHVLETAGPPAAVRLTPTVGSDGLWADGADVAMFDFEVVDAEGRRVPTDEARVDFSMSGPGIWRGGYNSGIEGSINNTYLLTEAGINRVFVRSTLTPGTITVTATREGLAAASASVESQAARVIDGLTYE